MEIILIHGMGRTPLSMLRLRQRLRRAGHAALLFGYSPTFETLQGASGRLARLIERRVGSAPYALVGHSLGSVIIRATLARLAGHIPVACFFLAPPMVACKAARFFSRFWLYKKIMGEMGRLLAAEDFMRGLPLPPGLFRIYAGTAGPRATWFPFGMTENDGILCVAEATGHCAAATVRVPALHTFIMNSAPVVDDMIRTLAGLAALRTTRTSHPPEQDRKPRP